VRRNEIVGRVFVASGIEGCHRIDLAQYLLEQLRGFGLVR